MFADDTTVFSRDDSQLCDTNFEFVKDWFSSNMLNLHDLTIHRICLTSDKSIIKQSNPVKTRGVLLDSHLTWGPYIDYTCIKISKQLFVLRQHKRCLTEDVSKTPILCNCS